MIATATTGTAEFTATADPASFTVTLGAEGQSTIEADNPGPTLTDDSTLPTIEIED